MIRPAERLALETSDDLYLSLISPDDAVDIRTYMNDNPSVMVNAPEGMQVSEWRSGMIVENHLRNIEVGLEAPYLLRQSDGEVIGFMQLEHRADYAAADYSVAERMRGQGLASLAIQRLVEQGQEQRGLRRVGFWIEAKNLASQSVARKLGAMHSDTTGSPDSKDIILQYWEKTL